VATPSSRQPVRLPAKSAPTRHSERRATANLQARLVAIGGNTPRVHPLNADATSIGGGGSNDIVIDSTTVSRCHAVIRRRYGRYVLTDLESTNGTFLNGKRIKNPVALRRGDEVRFGSARFAVMLPQRSLISRLRAMALLMIALFVIGFTAVWYLRRGKEVTVVPAPIPSVAIRPSAAPRASVAAAPATAIAVPSPIVAPSPIAVSSPPPAPSTAATIAVTPALSRTAPSAIATPGVTVIGTSWLVTLNSYRKQCGLTPVIEDPELSKGDGAHVRYLLSNYGDAIRSGQAPGLEMHQEHEGSPGYSTEGFTAGRRSDIDYVYLRGRKMKLMDSFAVIGWISTPFHRLPLLNPSLHRVGYAMVCDKGLCLAALDVRGGADTGMLNQPYQHPIEFPPDGATTDMRTFLKETPDPLSSCPGYAPPTGLAITLTLGSFVPVKLESFAIDVTSRDGKKSRVDACGFDANSYSNPDPAEQAVARSGMRGYSSVVVIPRRPLERGATYHVDIGAIGRHYAWNFTVAN
jgi:pSer/pThr/pTyr-binding forkhead associated (FHA) protein